MPTTQHDTASPRPPRRPLGRGATDGTADPEPDPADPGRATDADGPDGPAAAEAPGAGAPEPAAPEEAPEPAAPEEAPEADAPGAPEADAGGNADEPPAAPGATEPTGPVATEPAAPGATEPTGPVATEPAAPGATEPAAPGSTDEAPDAPADGRFTVRLDNFEGPFDLLLQLISKHKMDVTEVALSQVTDEFMAYIRAMGTDWDLDQTTEFLVVAATLLDLKAARLLPVAAVEDEADLALLEARDLLFARLLQYRAYKRIADIFGERLADEARRYPRTVGLEPEHAELLPEVVLGIGPEGFARLAVKAMQPRARPQVYTDHIHAPLVSVAEQAEVVAALLREAGARTFAELVADAPDTLTVVARFLALLELYRERAVALDQPEALGPLTARWTGTDGAVPQVTDGYEGRPADGPEDTADGTSGGSEDEDDEEERA
ncbi:segregation/condensation protein A [Streptomyces sp. BBFR2]|uniref:segregation/condensation protein A n=1 Tax=Streptomyces sp. BBFR2 TaxID=3372854 RepID=UPI0037DA2163